MGWLQTVLHIVIGVIVFAEGLNKLERSDLLERGLTLRQRIVTILKVLGWFAIVLGSAGMIVASLLPPAYVELGYTLMVLGFALLVLRSRVRETPAGQRRIESDDFDRTQVLRR